jgi:hypothetical protein
MTKSFVLQRQVQEGQRAFWFDAQHFETKEAAERHLNFERASQQAAIIGRGGASYTGGRVQSMRIIKLI